MPSELYRHSLEVGASAAFLAQRHGGDEEKAYLTGLLHDYGKVYSIDQLLEYAWELNLSLDQVTRKVPPLLHAPVGAALLTRGFNITDEEILEAVHYHTTGAPELGVLSKIIFLADLIEKGRSYSGVEEIRELAEYNLQRALLAGVESTIKRVLELGALLHPNTILFRNELINEIREEE